jgi:hypothetical protein
MTKAIAGVLTTAYWNYKSDVNLLALQAAQAVYYAAAYPTSTIGVLYVATTAYATNSSAAN